MKCVLSILTFVLINTISIQAAVDDPDQWWYWGFVLEYAPKDPANNSISISRNLAYYEGFMQEIHDDDFVTPRGDIIVFPEKGLTGLDPIEDISTYSVVPSPEDHIVPCDNETWSEILRRLSCSARDNQLYAVVNLPERAPCLSTENCPERGWFQYNTNVVFDRNGTVIATYRKYHLVEGVDVDTDPAPAQETTIFGTDFGVKFLVLTGADILHPDTYTDVLNKGDVKQIVYPSAWYSSLPFHTTIQYQAGWAEGNGVTLLASGISETSSGFAGAGIYESNGDMGYSIQENWAITFMGAPVPRSYNQTSFQEKPRHFKRSKNTQDVFNTNDNNKEEGLQLGRESLESFESVIFEISDLNGVLEANLSSCSLNASYSKPDNNKTYYYRLVTYDGSDGMEICSLLDCQGPELDDCTTRRQNFADGVSFVEISISGVFALVDKQDLIMPTTLQDFLSTSSNYYFRKEKIETENKTRVSLDWANKGEMLWTFGIYGKASRSIKI